MRGTDRYGGRNKSQARSIRGPERADRPRYPVPRADRGRTEMPGPCCPRIGRALRPETRAWCRRSEGPGVRRSSRESAVRLSSLHHHADASDASIALQTDSGTRRAASSTNSNRHPARRSQPVRPPPRQQRRNIRASPPPTGEYRARHRPPTQRSVPNLSETNRAAGDGITADGDRAAQEPDRIEIGEGNPNNGDAKHEWRHSRQGLDR